MPTRMTQPTLEQSRGYDIVIWVDEGGRIMANSFTVLGEIILHGLLPNHSMGKPEEIEAPPEEFFRGVPPGTNVGLTDVGGRGVFPFMAGHAGIGYGELH